MSLPDSAAGADVSGLFAAIDAQDTDTFLAYLTPDALFRFGSAPPAKGREAIAAAVGGFFGSIASLSHDLSKTASDGDTLFVEGEVTYTRHDGSTLTVPFTDVFEYDGELISEYKIYIDISELYAE